LKGEFTFGLNRIYLMFPELGFTTSCLVVVNELVIAQSAAEMMALTLPKFITWRARRYTPSWRGFNQDPSLMYLDTDFTGSENFSGEATRHICGHAAGIFHGISGSDPGWCGSQLCHAG
jgi:hypothetical protein